MLTFEQKETNDGRTVYELTFEESGVTYHSFFMETNVETTETKSVENGLKIRIGCKADC